MPTNSKSSNSRPSSSRSSSSRAPAKAPSAVVAKPSLAEALAGLPPRVRVHELARRAGLNSKDAIAALAKAGVAVGAASSSVDQDVAQNLLTALLGGSPKAGSSAGGRSRAKADDTTDRGKTDNNKPAAQKKASRSESGKTAPEPPDDATAAEQPKRRRTAKSATSDGAEPKGVADKAADDAAADDGATGNGAAEKRATSARKAPAGKSPVRATTGAAAADSELDTDVDEDSSHDAGDSGDAGDSAGGSHGRRRRRGGRGRRGGRSSHSEQTDGDASDGTESSGPGSSDGSDSADDADGAGSTGQHDADQDSDSADGTGRRSRRRGGRKNGDDNGSKAAADSDADSAGTADREASGETTAGGTSSTDTDVDTDTDGEDGEQSDSRRRRRRRRRRSGSSSDTDGDSDGETRSDSHSDSRSDSHSDSHGDSHDGRAKRSNSASGVQAVRGSTRLEAKRQRRRDSRDSRRRPQILSEAEFLARRESVDRVMAVRQQGDLAQVALLEDGVLVEHFVSQHGNASMIGNIYLGRVQNVLPSMEAAFADIGKGRNAVLYAGEVNWDIAGLEGKERRIETALSGGDTVLVQVSKDPIGHKGARLTTQISLPGRFLVFVPGGGATGISRKLPDNERKRLKKILDKIVPADAGVIIRTAAEGVGEEDLAADVERLKAQWQEISEAARKGTDSGSAPKQLYTEPDTLIKVVRDLFNSDINRLLVDGDEAWASISEYVLAVAPELADRVSRYVGDRDVFEAFRIDEQITKALQHKVRLPSGGSLVIDRTEAMTVIDVNTGKFTGSGGNLEETVTRNNLEAAEEIVRQLRLRDIGGIIVVDFIDMVLESNRDLVLTRLTECLGRDRTRHQVAEVTSLGLIQMTRKRMGLGLVEAFSEPCTACGGRGILLHDVPSDSALDDADAEFGNRSRKGRKRGKHNDGADDAAKFEPLVVERVAADAKPDPRGPRPPVSFRSEADAAGEVAVEAALVAETAEMPEETAASAPKSRSRGRGKAAAKVSSDSAPENGAAAVEVVDAAADAPVSDSTASNSSSTRAARSRTGSSRAAGAAARESSRKVAQPAAAEPVAPAELVTVAEPVAAEPAATPPVRRRRSAGRPAGAPATATGALDLILPVPSAAAEVSTEKLATDRA